MYNSTRSFAEDETFEPEDSLELSVEIDLPSCASSSAEDAASSGGWTYETSMDSARKMNIKHKLDK